MTVLEDEICALRRQRNLAALAAVGVMAVALAITLPLSVARDRRERAAANRLLDLERSVLRIQQLARDEQLEIIRTQNEIRSLLRPGP